MGSRKWCSSTYEKRFYPLREYPEYVITKLGKVYKGTGFPIGERVEEEEDADGQVYVTITNAKGRLRRVSIADLKKDTFPDLYKVVTPNLELDGDEFVLIAKHPAFEINRRGEVRRVDTGAYLGLFYRPNKRTPVYHLYNRTCYVNRLLYEAFGEGAAEAAGYKAPKEELKHRRLQEIEQRKRYYAQKLAARRMELAARKAQIRVVALCERCGKECEEGQHLCNECWKKERGYM